MLFGYNWWAEEHSYLDKSAECHPGMRHLKSLADTYFRWPGTAATESDGNSTNESDYAEQTDLMRMGYQITNMSRPERWATLQRAVQRLGLREVVSTIASHIRSRKRQTNGAQRYANAIREWNHDLLRLRLNYYRGSEVDFNWPPTDP